MNLLRDLFRNIKFYFLIKHDPTHEIIPLSMFQSTFAMKTICSVNTHRLHFWNFTFYNIILFYKLFKNY